MRPIFFTLLLLLEFGVFLGVECRALEKPGENLKEVGLTTKNGELVDLSYTFVNQDGEVRTLGSYFSEERPTILVPAYYDCPRLCGLLLKGVSELLPRIGLNLGTDYNVVTVSFNPKDDADSAGEVASRYRAQIADSAGNNDDWAFLAGDNDNIVPLMKQLGFHYKEDRGEFAHTAAIFILAPNGMISQHFTGISFPFRDVRLSIVEASKGEVGTLLDHALLFCFRFDPTEGKYTLAAFNVMRAGGLITLVTLAGLIVWLRMRERRSSDEEKGI
ncbi:MAG: SCO family protein [Bdellovibrionales bacterium]|nr:SCO family protein [Bdellovibrionales bacterium]